MHLATPACSLQCLAPLQRGPRGPLCGPVCSKPSCLRPTTPPHRPLLPSHPHQFTSSFPLLCHLLHLRPDQDSRGPRYRRLVARTARRHGRTDPAPPAGARYAAIKRRPHGSPNHGHDHPSDDTSCILCHAPHGAPRRSMPQVSRLRDSPGVGHRRRHVSCGSPIPRTEDQGAATHASTRCAGVSDDHWCVPQQQTIMKSGIDCAGAVFAERGAQGRRAQLGPLDPEVKQGDPTPPRDATRPTRPAAALGRLALVTLLSAGLVLANDCSTTYWYPYSASLARPNDQRPAAIEAGCAAVSHGPSHGCPAHSRWDRRSEPARDELDTI